MNNMNQINEFKISVYRAIDEPTLCEEYSVGHIKVLTDFGIVNVTSSNKNWLDNKNTFCIIAQEKSTNKMVGGIKIQVADNLFPLPVETAIGKIDKRIFDNVKYYKENGGVAELCGLWVSNQIKGIGMAAYLVRSAIASTKQLEFATMIGICAGYSLKMFKNVGFKIDSGLGDSGNFSYPNENYIAHVVGILNASTLENASEFDKNIMLNLRANPIQDQEEVTNNIKTNISYNLIYKTVSIDNF